MRRTTVHPPSVLRAYVHRRARGRFPYPEGYAVFARGRHAIWHAAKVLGLAPGDEVLVPAFHCGSEIEALLNASLTCRAYDLVEGLEPNQYELDSLVNPRTKALYLIDYLGFPQDARRWRAWCDERGLVLIEDAAQAWLARSEGHPVGWLADAVIFCPYKSYGMPSIALCVAPGCSLGRMRPTFEDIVRTSSTQAALWTVSTRLGKSLWDLRQSAFSSSTDGVAPDGVADASSHGDIALGDPMTPPSPATFSLLGRVVASGGYSIRRRNYMLLSERLAEWQPKVFRALPAGACPMAFPVRVPDPDRLMVQLAGVGVGAWKPWQSPHPIFADREFPGTRRFGASLTCLPVHQYLRRQDMQMVGDAAVEALQACAGPP